MKKILITGAGGFIGSHLVEKCVEKGYQVKAFVRYNSRNNWGNLENSWCKKEIEIVQGDIRDFDSVYKAIDGCETIFHLAALIGIPYSYFTPLAYIKTNIEGTYNVLEASKIHDASDIIITSTSETYGTAQYTPIDEKHPLVGQSPYSASKISSDQLAISYYRTFKLPIKIVRPFNTYGPRQSARAVIITIITQILKGMSEVKLGNIHTVRDFTYINDTISGFLKVWKTKKLLGEVVNIGMNKSISINEIFNTIAMLTEKEVKIISKKNRIRPKQSEVEKLVCDNTKLKTWTNWIPKYNLERGLLETIEWVKKRKEKFKTNIYNI